MMTSSANLDDVVQGWLSSFGAALESGQRAGVESLFLEQTYWRDQIALSWDMQQQAGRDAVVEKLIKASECTGPSNFRVDVDRPAPTRIILAGRNLIEAYFLFDLAHGTGQGLVRLSDDADSPAGAHCFMIGTDLLSVDGVVEEMCNRVTRQRLTPVFPIHGYKPMHRGQHFSEFSLEKQTFSERDPDVLIIGGGHTGMCVGARLERMGQSYLIVDRAERPGDSWRVRYESLALHTVGAVNQLPYIRTPDIFPDYVPKDLWADWLESYAKLMRLNMWTRTEVVKGDFDDERSEYIVELKMADGSIRVVHPKHVVMATGGIGLNPKPFKYPGVETFKGPIIHTKHYKSGADFIGRKVLVVGSGTSAFDMCYDLVLKGAKPTMLQRSETSVVPLEEGVRYNRDYLPGGLAQDTADLRRGAGAVYSVLVDLLKEETKACNERNAKLYADLRKAGLWLGDGPDGTGWLGKLFRTFKGFHLDMGVLQEIIDGNVKIQQASAAECFVESGLKLNDGTILEFDAVVSATGFMNSNEDVAQIFGAKIAEKIGLCSGLDATGEPIGLAKPLGQRQFWQLYGGVNDCRRLSRHLALQIIAQLRGVVPALERQRDGSVGVAESTKELT
ncbi:flavin-containing monooxygenase [Paraburkholderia sediminicola]|uniref:flavin-containing monooxygenase n=1 Tax=Paraburkholderia sediminicola TaxID=458836 RepID=UPI0038BC24EB